MTDFKDIAKFRPFIEQTLRENGYDGLVNVEMECGCVIGDIMPCGEIDNVINELVGCQCGYSNPIRAAENGCDYWMQLNKPEVTND